MIARIPATSANLGPGFDSLGMALSLWAEIGLVDQAGLVPDGAHIADEHHLATVAFRKVGGAGALWVRSPIPMGRGLGYSAAVRVGGVLLGIAQREPASVEVITRFSDEILLEATNLEGHADNAAPALLGGVVASAGQRSIHVPLQLDPAVVVWIPSFSTRTDRSRAQLAPLVPFADVVFNIGRTAFLVAALASGDVDALGHGMQDRIHQPTRFAAAPASRRAYDAALAAGAWCSWLSGSGPTVAALCAVELAPIVAAALPDDGHTKVLRIDHGGATLER